MDFGLNMHFTDVLSVNADSPLSLIVLNSYVVPCLVQNYVNYIMPCRFRRGCPFVPIDSVNVKKITQKYRIFGCVIK